jgi:dolichyl-phosphate-mannose--protein O-mannosyl transferase
MQFIHKRRRVNLSQNAKSARAFALTLCHSKNYRSPYRPRPDFAAGFAAVFTAGLAAATGFVGVFTGAAAGLLALATLFFSLRV